MKKLLKRWAVAIALKLMSNRTIRTWTLCFALRHAPVQKLLKELGIEDEKTQGK